MLSLKLLQHIHLLLLVTRHPARLLLSLIVHHLLDHGAGLTIQITQTRVLGLDLGDINLGRGLDNVWPPFHFVHFVEVDVDFFARRGWGGFEGP